MVLNSIGSFKILFSLFRGVQSPKTHSFDYISNHFSYYLTFFIITLSHPLIVIFSPLYPLKGTLGFPLPGFGLPASCQPRLNTAASSRAYLSRSGSKRPVSGFLCSARSGALLRIAAVRNGAPRLVCFNHFGLPRGPCLLLFIHVES